MAIPLLSTKLHAPPIRSGLVLRPHLIERLDTGVDRGRALTLVCAPAGFGKTTLVSEWTNQRIGESASGRPVAWLSLDEGDNDPARFLAYLAAALQQVDESIGRELGAAQRPVGDVPMQALMTTLVNDVAALSTPLVLVLDDYQVIDEPRIHQGVAFLLDHQPQSLHLVVATREDPPLPLSRLRARGWMTEIRGNDLRFSEAEAAALLNQIQGLDLTPEQIAALEARTEGWVAGLQLAAISMQGRRDRSNFVRSFSGSHRYVLDYLTEEALQRQPDEIRAFLLQTSILDRLSGPLCDALTEQGSGQEILERLESANLFIVPLDDRRRWYRYHHLFRAFLRHRLERELEKPALKALHRRACAWLARHDLQAEAIRHAIAAGDFERAADLIEEIAGAMFGRGMTKSLQRWIEALPERLVSGRPGLCVIRAWVLHATGQWDAIEPCLREAERALDALGLPNDPQVLDLRGHIAVMRASRARRQNDFPLFFRQAEEALELLAEESLTVRTTITANLGLAHMLQGNLAAASEALREAQSLGRASDNLVSALNCAGFEAAVLIAQGRLRQAAAICRSTIDRHLEDHPRPLPTLGHVHAGLACVLYEWNDLEAAAAHLGRGAELGAQTPLPSTMRLRAGRLAWIRRVQGAGLGPAELPRRLAAMVEREQADPAARLDADFTAWRVRSWLAQGDLAAAAAWAAAYRTREPQSPVWRPCGELALARVSMARRRWNEALDTLSRVHQAAEKAGGTGWLIEALMLQALIHRAMGEIERAATALSQALALAEPQDYVRLFLDEGAPMAALLERIGSRGVTPEYVSGLLAAFGTTGDVGAAHPCLLPEPLTERELEVLALIGAGLSNRQIAEKLVVALGTVKMHTHNIYSKLDVHSRTQAVARARALGLL